MWVVDLTEKISALCKNKYFCMIWLLFTVVFVTWYGAFPNWFSDRTYVATASQIGLDYPWHFKMWGIFSAISLILNITYLYRRYNFKSKAGTALMLAGCACILVTINIPSTEIMSVRLVAHWSTALLFAALNACSIVVFLSGKVRQSKPMLFTLIIYILMLVLMIVLLIINGKNGAIESIPYWGTYLILFMLNYTNIYKKDLSQVIHKTENKEKLSAVK